jgi:hypothetical protein
MAQLTTDKSVEPFAHIWDQNGPHLLAILQKLL